MKTLVKTHLNYDPICPETIYHYCSVKTMKSIFDNASLWLSDMAQTNDYTENHWVMGIVPDIFHRFLDEYKSNLDDKVLHRIQGILKDIFDKIAAYSIPNVSNTKKFITCFSEKGDLLGQWRAYADDGRGVSIGFNSEVFNFFKDSNQYEFIKVIYNQKEMEKFLYKVVSENFKYIIDDCIERDAIDDCLYGMKFQVSILINTIYNEGFIFKNGNFEEENEWRLYRNILTSNYDDSDGIDDYGYSETNEGIMVDNLKYVGDFSRRKLKFVATDESIKPYLELGFEKIKSKIINEIILGPKCKIDPLDFKLYLVSNNYLRDIYDNSISIKFSSIPYI